MRWLFTTFPDGASGVGLLLLRAAVGLVVILHANSWLFGAGDTGSGVWLAGALALVSATLLLAGFMTPVAGGIVALGAAGAALWWFPLQTTNQAETRLLMAFVVVVGTAIVLLGPGALSVDARLFGRRQIIIPRPTRPPKP